ncbi:MFS transporter [Paucibacter sp. R3-3]|uniref:MFS transporter n=1 Tax=Roseateles agri TaxID=3098619 RepID=A0ABU5DP85_9BURK|nr:MFS transporter [Paucibacter sp. R3-3]MDY0748132.1 MFS transporter [Paucibacter sp. R3-3]
MKTNTAAIDLTEFKQGWRIVILAMLGLAINANASMLYAFGSFVIPLQTAFGWGRGDIQSAVTFLFASAVVASQIVPWLNLRYGMKRVTCASLVCLALSFASISLMGPSIAWLYFFFALLPLASMGTIHVTWTYLVNLWFVRNRGLGLALVLSGTGISAALLPSAVTWAIGRWGWQGGFWLLATLPVLVVLPFAVFWMKEPAGIAARADGTRPTAVVAGGLTFAQGLRSMRFWFLNIGLSLVVGAIVTMVSNTVPMLRDKGLTAAAAGAVFGGFGLSLIGGRVLVGYLIDRLWAPGVAAVALALPALGCLLLATTGAEQTGILLLATALVGLGAGAEFDIAAYLMSRYFGLRDYGRLFGVHLGLITAAGALAPWLSGIVYKSTGNYMMMLTLCGSAFLIGASSLLPLGRYPKFD